MVSEQEAKAMKEAAGMSWMALVKASCIDEDGDISNPRVLSSILVVTGVFVIIAGFILFMFGVNGTPGFIGIILAACWGTSTGATAFSQLKSASVKVERTKSETAIATHTTTTTTTNPIATTPTTTPTTAAKEATKINTIAGNDAP